MEEVCSWESKKKGNDFYSIQKAVPIFWRFLRTVYR